LTEQPLARQEVLSFMELVTYELHRVTAINQRKQQVCSHTSGQIVRIADNHNYNETGS